MGHAHLLTRLNLTPDFVVLVVYNAHGHPRDMATLIGAQLIDSRGHIARQFCTWITNTFQLN